MLEKVQASLPFPADNTPLVSWSFELVGIPPSVNALYGTAKAGHVFNRPEYVKWTFENTVNLMALFRQRQFPAERVSVSIEVTGGKGWRKPRDLDNCAKAVFDLLVKAKVIFDDNCDIVRRITMAYNDAPRQKRPPVAKCFVTVTELRQ